MISSPRKAAREIVRRVFMNKWLMLGLVLLGLLCGWMYSMTQERCFLAALELGTKTDQSSEILPEFLVLRRLVFEPANLRKLVEAPNDDAVKRQIERIHRTMSLLPIVSTTVWRLELPIPAPSPERANELLVSYVNAIQQQFATSLAQRRSAKSAVIAPVMYREGEEPKTTGVIQAGLAEELDSLSGRVDPDRLAEQIQQIQRRLDALKGDPGAWPTGINPTLDGLTAQWRELKQRGSQSTTFFTADHPRMKALTQQREELSSRLNAVAEQTREQLTKELQLLEAKQAKLQAAQENAPIPPRSTPRLSPPTFAGAGKVGRLLLAGPFVQPTPISPRTFFNTIIGGLGGLLAASVLVFVRSVTDTRLHAPMDFDQMSVPIDVLGSIPYTRHDAPVRFERSA